ncbi:NACHT domain-containing protein [Microbispora triticiradicis]
MSYSLAIARAVILPIARMILADREKKRSQSLPLAELINVRITDDFKKRALTREVEAAIDLVAQRLEPLLEREWPGLSRSDKDAALFEVIRVFESADLSDAALFADDVNPDLLAQRLKKQALRTAVQSLGEPASALFHKLLDECCILYVQLLIHIAPFSARAIAELLSRSTSLSRQVDLVLERIPAPTLDAPAGTSHDAEFTNRYLTHISTMLDDLELFGVDVHRYRLNTSLSVAYIPLRVTSDPASDYETSLDWSRGELQSGEVDTEASSLRIEQALRESRRTLIRGEAGSGKTTLISWLAINAARSSFGTALQELNGSVPFIIKLRSFVGKSLPRPEMFINEVAGPMVDLMPSGWAHRILSAGTALLLVDGVDELPAGERASVRNWLKGLLTQFPNMRVVVTARPSAAKHQWLAHLGFGSAILDRMGPSEVRALIAHWHEAILASGNSPCDAAGLAIHERKLVSSLDSAPHLQALATNPLLCAMLCALNLDRHSALPPDRMGIYRAALEMLLERRDVERGVQVEAVPFLDISTKLETLQYLAWRSSLNGRTELDYRQAVRQISERLAMLSIAVRNSEGVLDYLLNRSSVIREVVPGRISFVHRTFQEYLTAREAAEQGDVGLLLGKAHLDTWRETVVMAVGHGNLPTRTALLKGILDRADREKRHARRLRILAASCLETAGPIDQDLRSTVDRYVHTLLPPRKMDEVQSLVSAGAAILKYLPDSIAGLSLEATRATIATAALIGGPEALHKLSLYSRDNRRAVGEYLVSQSKYFDPQEYGERVLENAALSRSRLFIDSRAELRALQAMSRKAQEKVAISRVQLHDVVDVAAELGNMKRISELWMEGTFSDLTTISRLASTLREIILWTSVSLSSDSIEAISLMPRLKTLAIGSGGRFENIEFVSRLSKLQELWLYELDHVASLQPLADLGNLEVLRLGDLRRPDLMQAIHTLPKMHSLYLVHAPVTAQLAELVPAMKRIQSLYIWEDKWLETLAPLGKLEKLEFLDVASQELADIGDVSEFGHLKEVVLSCPQIEDHSPLARIPGLMSLTLKSPVRRFDREPFAEAGIRVEYLGDEVVPGVDSDDVIV